MGNVFKNALDFIKKKDYICDNREQGFTDENFNRCNPISNTNDSHVQNVDNKYYNPNTHVILSDVTESEKSFDFENYKDDVIGRVFTGYGGRGLSDENIAVQRVYPFSNEILEEVFDGIDVKGKSVCTVGSSGDQVLYSVLKGATDVTLIDANPISKYYTELKIAGIKNLSFGEFDKYFSYTDILNPRIYAKISHDLSKESQEFWDSVILECDDPINEEFWGEGFLKSTNARLTANIFQHLDCNFYTANAHVFENHKKNLSYYYKSLSDFLALKQNLINANITYICEELSGFSDALGDKQFDLILLSNIYDYCDSKIFLKAFEKLYEKNLKLGGVIQPQYSFMDAERSEGGVCDWNGYKCKKEILNAGRWLESNYMIQKELSD